MNVSRCVLVVGAVIAASSVFAACVGDDPSAVTSAPDDSGTQQDGATPADGSVADGAVTDGGVTSDAATAITPASLGSRLSFWYRGSSLTSDAGAAVTLWLDESPNANAATSGGLKPTVGAGPNGTKAVVFTPNFGGSVSLQIPSSPSLKWGKGDFLVFVVARFSNQLDAGGVNYTGGAFLASAVSGAVGIGLYGGTGVPGSSPLTYGIEGVINPGGPLETTAGANDNDGAFRIYGFRRRGSTLESYVGSSHTPANVGSSNADLTPDASAFTYFIGNGGFPAGWQLNGAIAEMIGAGDGTSVITDAERDGLLDYLAHAYGL